jgi:hypothetical protein
MPVVILHCFDELEKCHLISNFVLHKEPDGMSLRVTYEELSSSPTLAVKLGAGKIRKAHEAVLASLATRVLEAQASVPATLRTSVRHLGMLPRGSGRQTAARPPVVEEEEEEELEMPDILTVSRAWDMDVAFLQDVPAPSKKKAQAAALNSSLTNINRFKSQELRLKLVEQKFVNGSFVLALNAETDTFEEGKWCDLSIVQFSSLPSARILKFEDGLYEVKFKASGELQCCDEVELKRLVRSSPRTSPKVKAMRQVVAESIALDDDDTPPSSVAPTPGFSPSPLTWQISSIDDVATLFTDEADTMELYE